MIPLFQIELGLQGLILVLVFHTVTRYSVLLLGWIVFLLPDHKKLLNPELSKMKPLFQEYYGDYQMLILELQHVLPDQQT